VPNASLPTGGRCGHGRKCPETAEDIVLKDPKETIPGDADTDVRRRTVFPPPRNPGGIGAGKR